MATWKELGEVPDSEDESTWDSQESQSPSLPDPPVPVAARADAATTTAADPAGSAVSSKSHAIWDIPQSSQISVEDYNVHSGPTPQELEPLSQLSTPRSPINESRRESTPPLSSLLELGHGNEKIVLIRSPVGLDRAMSEDSVLSSPPDVPDQFTFGLQQAPITQENEGIRHEGGRLGRSLRPRKPIQEHPYLLESVQYSKTWKSHGLRPVRVLAEEQQKRMQEDDSQEQDFEDDSQLTSKDPAPEESEESQITGHLDTFPDIEDILLSDDGEPTPTPEPRIPRPEQTIQSSQEDEEFPDPNDVERWKLNRTAPHKRQSSPKTSVRRKRPRVGESVRAAEDIPVLPDINDIFDIPASPPQTSPGVLATTPMAIVNRLGGKPMPTLTPKPSSNISSRVHSPAPGHQHSETIDLTALENGDSEDDSDVTSSSESESDQVRLGARRIRGVLPASWLRLDQQTSMQKPKPTTQHHSPDLSPDRSGRKGVAQRRLVSPRVGGDSALFLSDDSDDSDSAVRPHQPDISFRDIASPTIEDDTMSIVEEDHIDRMFSRRKRVSTGSSGLPRKRKRSQQSIFNGQPGQRKRQQRITGLLGGTKSDFSTPTRRVQVSKGAGQLQNRNSGKKKPSTSQPPRLSILDVAEPDAPAFIRIAARTASRRQDRGRSSPSKKAIMLGTRKDTIDAVGVLKRWSEGMIQPRDSVSQSTHSKPHHDEVIKSTIQSQVIQSLKPRNGQASHVTAPTHFSQPRRLVKQTSINSFVDIGVRPQPKPGLSTEHFSVERCRPHDLLSRPAQLEMAGDAANRYTFDARKRVLDALYRRSRTSLLTPRNLCLEQSISGQTTVLSRQHTPEALESIENRQALKLKGNRRRARHRKQAHPNSVDVSAPQYAHANDPLPRELSPPTVVPDQSEIKVAGKLLGLGPYGTHYTQNFEMFPLDQGVYFHETTLLGSGRLQKAVDGKSLGNLGAHRGQCTFTIDEQTLHWGPWDARTSSELGIIFDWVTDRLSTSSVDCELETTTPVQAAEFVLIYLQDHLAFAESESSNIFVSRFVDVLRAVEQRFKELSTDSRYAGRSFVEVLTRILVIAVQCLRLCEKLNKISEGFQMEEILKRLAVTTAEILLRTDLREIRDMYGRLQQMSFREKGIRNDEYSLICWVSLIRILEEARLPRAGFWGVISSTILGPNTDGVFDAAVLERAWHTLFTLLPLGEFNSMGVAVPGVRRTAPLEGWMIPQRLLARVFNLYQSNDRQSPSFNDYLRATVSRCHYLVEQWGWYKCNAILGTIFDFFAAQDLHNLRNEEVYQSPQFLEELSESPSLVTTPEDRCFHIYLKLIAMSIKRLKKVGMVKEIKNLVARLLPNHSRQYDKMIATHEAEIAALRNHHDLLCTLFWAAPPDMRPSIQSIEGLVVLGSSHKEACLINLRAWSRLSRFVVSSCEDVSAYKPLADWQRNISQQVLEQFLSVEAEVDQQLLGMSVEASKNITEHFKNAVISRNKKVAMDLLHFSLKAFLDVMRHTRNLGAASFVLNQCPLEQILTRLSFSSENSDWGVLRVVLDILSYFLTRIDKFTSAEHEHAGQSWHEEDAIMLLERKFASPLIHVVRGVVNLKPRVVGVSQVGDRELCIEQAVVLAGRLGACLINSRLARFRQFFQAGKYNIFQDISKSTVSAGQRYVALFLATMADKEVANFKDLRLTSLDIFLAEIIKPFEHLAFENRLATSFKRIGEAYLQDAVIEVGNTPDYSSNRDLFKHIIVSMRKALFRADAGQKPQLQQTLSKALRFIMDRMKSDLKSMVLNSPEHLNHVEFVRSIISLIRSQDICPVDSFFYQISPEYSPSKQDPRLQTAGILSWALKLEEGDSKAVSGLFYLLFPSFKIALANGELGNEANILKESMKHGQVFNFVLNTMLPAIISTAVQVSEGWVLLDTYVEAVDAWLSAPCIHRDIGEDIMVDILALYTMVLASLGSLRTRASPTLQHQDLLSLNAMIKTLNLLSPSVTAYLINNPQSQILHGFKQVIDELTDFTHAADVYLSELVTYCDNELTTIEASNQLFNGLGITGPETAARSNEQIDKFSRHMTQDILNNWVSSKDSITIRGPSRPQKPSATQTGQGTPLPKWSGRELLRKLGEQTRTWNHAHNAMTRTVSHEALLDEIIF